MRVCWGDFATECSSSFAPSRLLLRRLKRPARNCGTLIFLGLCWTARIKVRNIIRIIPIRRTEYPLLAIQKS